MTRTERLWLLKRDGRKSVVRLKDGKRDVFGDGLKVEESLQSVPCFDAMLHVHTGDRRAKIRCRLGVVQYCTHPHAKNAVTENVRVLVVESRFDERSIYLYVTCPDWVLGSPAQMAIYAVRAAQAYCDWECAEETLAFRRGGAEGTAKPPARARADRDGLFRDKAGVCAGEGARQDVPPA